MPALKTLRINSIPALALSAFALAILPLVAALVTSTLYVNRLSTQGQQAIHEATVVANASQQLSDSLIAMERSARQYNILLDEELFTVYLGHRDNFSHALEMLRSLPVSTRMVEPLALIEREESAIHQGLQTILLGTPESARLLAGFTAINEQAKLIRDESARLKTAAVDKLQQSAQRARSLMWWQLAALLPVLVFVVYMFVVLILRPMRRLDRAIRTLGRGELATPIEVNGPQDIEELGQSLDWMRERINALENQKTLFLQHMSHELKTPLTSLREGSELLSEGVLGPLNEAQADVARLLKHNCLRLQEQIENLLRFSVAQSQTSDLDLTQFPLEALIDDTLKDHQLAIRHKALAVVTELQAITMTADREKLRMVIDNLLSNAVKYSPQGGTLRIQAACQNDQVSITVEDEGPGIPPEEQSQVFDAFFQGRITPRSAIKGSGIGLSVCQAYVRAHGGQVFVGPGDKGARLCILMPLQS